MLHHHGHCPCLFTQTVLFNQSPSLFGKAAAEQGRAITEAAVSSSVVHQNVVSTYHYDITAIKAKTTGTGSLQIEDGSPGDWKLFLVQVRRRQAGRCRRAGEEETGQEAMFLVQA